MKQTIKEKLFESIQDYYIKVAERTILEVYEQPYYDQHQAGSIRLTELGENRKSEQENIFKLVQYQFRAESTAPETELFYKSVNSLFNVSQIKVYFRKFYSIIFIFFSELRKITVTLNTF
jgi:hypothetical protein